MGPSRARVTPVEEERGKPTLVEARHQEEEEEEEGSRRLMWTRGFSCLQGKAAPVIPMGGKEGKLLARMSLAQGSLVDSLVELPTVATAVTTPSPSTTRASTTRAPTSRTRASTTPASTTPASTTKAPTSRTRASTTPAPTARTDASVTTARPSVTRMG